MIKRFLTLMVVFTTFVFIQSPVWAAVNDAAAKVEMQSNQVINPNIYTPGYYNQFFLQQDNSFQTVRRERGRDEGSGQVSGLWIVSIFIQGLGQILMGEVLRGLSFWLWDIVTLLIGSLILVASGNSPSMLNLTSAIVGISWLVIYIWNIVDAYNVAIEKADSEAMNLEQRMALIKKIENFSEKFVLKNDSITYQVKF